MTIDSIGRTPMNTAKGDGPTSIADAIDKLVKSRRLPVNQINDHPLLQSYDVIRAAELLLYKSAASLSDDNKKANVDWWNTCDDSPA